MTNIRNESIDLLFNTIMDLSSVDEFYDFFTDVCTVKELQDMAQRLQIAIMLDKGISYQNITKETGVSAATIGRVSRCLNYGSGGYRSVIDRMKNKTDR
ncbi:MAG: hypothetical protein E7233_13205 [Lachnospiraceae bacterium]|nr:hypothetical protein [Lachnospiraceae bacterium]